MAIIETTETENIELLKTHYYKASYEQLKEAYLEIVKKLNHKIVSINDDYGEIFSELPHLSCTVKIIMQNPKETSIDFYINSEYLLGSSKKGLKLIQEVYNHIEKKYELKGLGLHI